MCESEIYGGGLVFASPRSPICQASGSTDGAARRLAFATRAPTGRSSVLARIARLRIPPAWTDVEIAASERTAIQAWGFDAKGRRQYRYHPRAVERGDKRKYYRVRQLARDLPTIRAAVHRDFRKPGFGREQVAAGVLRLISE